MINIKKKLVAIGTLMVAFLAATPAFAQISPTSPFNRGGGNDCYKRYTKPDGGSICVSKKAYEEYLTYQERVKGTQNNNKTKFDQEYIYQNGRLKKLPNGRYVAKENDKDFVNQEVMCTENDYFVKGKRACFACDQGYQNTLNGGFGGKTPYNNPTTCSVLGAGSQNNGHKINIGNQFDITSAIGGSGGGNSGGGGMGGGNLATKAFVCLEYHTNSNGMTSGGEHLKFSKNMQYCQEPMNYYYQQLESYYCTQSGCYYLSPATILIRQMWLYTNPYIYIGTTMSRSDEIANSRTQYNTYGSWKGTYSYPM